METLRRIAIQVFSSHKVPNQINLTWHAGEPLALPLTYYQEAFAVVKDVVSRYNKTYRHTFQTNAISLDDHWCKLMKKNEINIGVIIDGPQHLHDYFRKTRSGGGTYEKTMRGIRRLQDANIPFSAIAVVTSRSLDYADEFLDFFDKNDIRNIALNPEESQGSNAKSSLSEEFYIKFRTFLIRLMERAGSSEKKFYIRELQYGFGMALNRDREKMFLAFAHAIDNPNFMPIMTFDVHGNCVPFAREFAGNLSDKYNNFVVGNVYEDSLDELSKKGVMQQMLSDFKSGIDLCRKKCDYFYFCGGDFSSNKFFEHGTLAASETTHCRFRRQALMEAVRTYLQSILETQPRQVVPNMPGH